MNRHGKWKLLRVRFALRLVVVTALKCLYFIHDSFQVSDIASERSDSSVRVLCVRYNFGLTGLYRFRQFNSLLKNPVFFGGGLGISCFKSGLESNGGFRDSGTDMETRHIMWLFDYSARARRR